MTLTRVNLFTVPLGEGDAFEARFKAVYEKLDGMAGFGGTELHRNVGIGDPTYGLVNIARWENAQAWREGNVRRPGRTRCRRSWRRAACCRAAWRRKRRVGISPA
jgi:heme-degrading monooxygenase HmoA